MELGLYHSCFLEWDLNRTFAWMAQRGLHTAELHGGPRYRLLRWDAVARGDTAAVLRPAEAHGIRIVDIMYGGLNFLHPDAAVRDRAAADCKVLLDAARQVGAASVSVFTGRDPLLSLDENFERMQTVFPPLIDHAESRGVRLLLENCPMAHEWPPRFNIAISPAMWERIFEHFRSPWFGLNFDPSHLVWQDIDYIDAAAAFARVIGLVQAKDTLRLPHVRRRAGMLDPQSWQHRIPGMGEVDWNRLLIALRHAGYPGPLILEHEDPCFSASAAAVEQGLDLSIAHLTPHLAGTVATRP